MSSPLTGRSIDITLANQEVAVVISRFEDYGTNIDRFHALWYEDVLALAAKLNVSEARPCVCGRQTSRQNPPSDDKRSYYQRVISIPMLGKCKVHVHEWICY